MAVKKPALGRGLGAFIENTSDEDNKNSVIEVDINKVEPGLGQPRKNFDKEKIEALSNSIKEHGIIQPLIVTKENNTYHIIAGERRWRAAKAAGFTKIPVIERSASTKEVMELALIENIQREDLNPIEEAEAYSKLIEEYSMTQEQVAAMVGRSRPSVANTLRLLNFSAEIQKMLIAGEITAGQARPILGLSSIEDQNKAADYIIKNELNARQAEQHIKKLVSKPQKAEKTEEETDTIKQQEIRYVQDRLRSSLGTKVLVNDNNGKGKITIEYYSKDERERLIDFLTKK